MSEKRRGLGRGLGALIPTTPDTDRSTPSRPVDVFFPDRTGAAGSSERAVTDERDAAHAEGGTRASAGGVSASSTEDGVALSEWAVVGSTSPDSEQHSRSEATSEGGGSDASDGLVEVPGAQFAEIPVDSIRPNPKQPRTVFDEDALAELVESVREVGVLQPVVVRAVEDGYELIMGERRWRAVQAAGLTSIPAIIRETGDGDLLRDALLENLHRSQLNPLEEAAAYQQLLEDFGCTQEELATRIHRSRPQISNTLRLLKLPAVVQRRIAAGVLSAGHARALLGLADGAAMERMAQRIVAEGLSVRAVEELVTLGGEDERKKRVAPRAGTHSVAVDDLAARLSDRFETRVKVSLGRARGRLTVEFASVQDLNRILATLAPDDPGLFKP